MQHNDGVIAVTGATGDVGGQTVERLLGAGPRVRVIVRRPEQVDTFTSQGADARLADLGDRAAVTAALDGVDQLFLVTAATPRQADDGRTAVYAARAAGVRAVVHLSGGDAAEHSPMPWAAAIWQVDEAVRASGLERTILHPSGFMTNLVASGPVIRRGIFPQTMGRGVIGWIDTADIAAVAATVLLRGEHSGAEPVLTGPAVVSHAGSQPGSGARSATSTCRAGCSGPCSARAGSTPGRPRASASSSVGSRDGASTAWTRSPTKSSASPGSLPTRSRTGLAGTATNCSVPVPLPEAHGAVIVPTRCSCTYPTQS